MGGFEINEARQISMWGMAGWANSYIIFLEFSTNPFGDFVVNWNEDMFE